MGKIIRLRSTIATPGAAAYAAGDEISNSAVAGSVVRPTFDLAGYTQGRILAAELDLTAASGNVVTTASDFELLLFRTPEVPAAVGDNVTHPIIAATRALAIGRFRIDATWWTNSLGAVAAGTSQVQAVTTRLGGPTVALEQIHADGFVFNFHGMPASDHSLTAVLRTLAAWDPFGAGPAVVNTFGITLDIEAL